jgi:catechol 2,3-dioxygenase-like lactoylglutathione lyase family enzyme
MTPRFDFIGLVVADLARSLDFYRRLGLEFPPDAEQQPHVEATLPSGLRIGWDPVSTIQSFDDSWTAPTGSPRVSLGFACSSPADVDSTYDAMVAAGYLGHLPPWDASWGMRYATLHDPDGNGLDLFVDLPTSGSSG